MKPESRKPLVVLARQYHCLPVAIALNIPERICAERNSLRSDRNFSNHVIRQHVQEMRRSLRRLDREGFRHVHILDSPDAIETATVDRQPLWCDRKGDYGPFDIIGDIHGCRSELEILLEKLGYDPATRRHPDGRKIVFLGDLVDRGPDIPGVLRIAMEMVGAGNAICVPGNHEMKLLRKLRGRDVQITHGLAESLEQLEREPVEFVEGAAKFIDGLVSHYVLDGGRLVVAHAGMKAAMQGRGSGKVREFALFGETTGETDEFDIGGTHLVRAGAAIP
jgi:protein phosphatase